MADKSTFKGAIFSLNPKIVLAFFNIIVAAALTVYFIGIVTNRPPNSPPLDAGTIAVIVGLITTFVLMAKSGSDYQFVSSAGSDKKDDAQTAVSKALADKVPAQSLPVSLPPQPWWPKLADDEKNIITASADGLGGATPDPRVKAFITASQVGAANAADLAYLVSKGLLTQDRANDIQAV